MLQINIFKNLGARFYWIRKFKKVQKALIRNSLIVVLVFCSSCNKSIAKYLPDRPSKSFKKTLQDASPEFRQGWKDGCEVGMSAGSNTFYKLFYDNNTVDGYKMTSSSEYKNAWGNAFWYCYRYDYIKQKSSMWGSMFGGYR